MHTQIYLGSSTTVHITVSFSCSFYRKKMGIVLVPHLTIERNSNKFIVCRKLSPNKAVLA